MIPHDPAWSCTPFFHHFLMSVLIGCLIDLLLIFKASLRSKINQKSIRNWSQKQSLFWSIVWFSSHFDRFSAYLEEAKALQILRKLMDFQSFTYSIQWFLDFICVWCLIDFEAEDAPKIEENRSKVNNLCQSKVGSHVWWTVNHFFINFGTQDGSKIAPI